jgi:hypothetical protein
MVDLPHKNNDDVPVRYVNVYQRALQLKIKMG